MVSSPDLQAAEVIRGRRLIANAPWQAKHDHGGQESLPGRYPVSDAHAVEVQRHRRREDRVGRLRSAALLPDTIRSQLRYFSSLAPTLQLGPRARPQGTMRLQWYGASRIILLPSFHTINVLTYQRSLPLLGVGP